MASTEMPIVGFDGDQPNDSFREQLIMNAEAAIDKIVDMGVGDRARVGLGGHSYGAFMTANLLAHSDLFAAGIDIIQLDEPYVQARPEAAKEYAVEAINRALEGATGTTVLHVCFGYGKHVEDKPDGYASLDELDGSTVDEISIECAQPRLKMDLLQGLPSKKVHVGVIDLRDTAIETPELVAERIEAALKFLPPERVVVAPDCGMKYLSREVAFGKLCNMVKGRDLLLQ